MSTGDPSERGEGRQGSDPAQRPQAAADGARPASPSKPPVFKSVAPGAANSPSRVPPRPPSNRAPAMRSVPGRESPLRVASMGLAVPKAARSSSMPPPSLVPPAASSSIRPDPAAEAKQDPVGLFAAVAGATSVGLVRDHNEDNFLVSDLTEGRALTMDSAGVYQVGPRGLLLVVCDGMGGAAAGEVASRMAVECVHDVMRAEPTPGNRDDFARRIVSSLEEAGKRIHSVALEDSEREGMGTTATMAGLIDKVLFVGQVGDSRAYIMRQGNLIQVTKDQSLVNQLLEAGQLQEDEVESFEHANIILQALGTSADIQVDLTFLELRRADRLLICSDGLSGLVTDDAIKAVLSQSRSPLECTRALTALANENGGYDNITVVVADFFGSELEPVKAGEHVAYQQYPLVPEGMDALRASTTATFAFAAKSIPPRALRQGRGPVNGALAVVAGRRRSWLGWSIAGLVIMSGIAALSFWSGVLSWPQ